MSTWDRGARRGLVAKGRWHVRVGTGDRMNKYTEFRIDVGVATGGLSSRWRANLLKRAGQEPQHAVALHEI